MSDRPGAPKPRSQPSRVERIWWSHLPLAFAIPVLLSMVLVVTSSGLRLGTLVAIALGGATTYAGWYLRWRLLLPVAVAAGDGVTMWIRQTGELVSGLSAADDVGCLRVFGTETWFLRFASDDRAGRLAYLGFMIRGRDRSRAR